MRNIADISEYVLRIEKSRSQCARFLNKDSIPVQTKICRSNPTKILSSCISSHKRQSSLTEYREYDVNYHAIAM